MESLMENKALLYALFGTSALVIGLACGFLPTIAFQLEVVEFPSEVSDRHRTKRFKTRSRTI